MLPAGKFIKLFSCKEEGKNHTTHGNDRTEKNDRTRKRIGKIRGAPLRTHVTEAASGQAIPSIRPYFQKTNRIAGPADSLAAPASAAIRPARRIT